MKKAILYINQFFGQIGGEEKAGIEPEIHEGQIGPAMQFEKELNAEVTHTIICGDNYIGTNTDAAVATILGMLEDKEIFSLQDQHFRQDVIPLHVEQSARQ